MKFRSKPQEIEAVKASDALRHAANDWKLLPMWLRASYEKGNIVFEPKRIHVHTNHGIAIAELDDWLILGLHDEVYPCSAVVFSAKYEAVV